MIHHSIIFTRPCAKAVDREIVKLEEEHAHTTMTLNEEKKIMVQIKDLSKSRETVREYNGLQAGWPLRTDSPAYCVLIAYRRARTDSPAHCLRIVYQCVPPPSKPGLPLRTD